MLQNDTATSDWATRIVYGSPVARREPTGVSGVCEKKWGGGHGDGDVGKGAGSEKVVMNVPTEMSFVPTCILKQSEMMRQV